MITHELLIAAIQEKWPHLIHGEDYLVAHPIDTKTGKQRGPAYIMRWKGNNPPQPDKVTEAMLLISAQKFIPDHTGEKVRMRRNMLILGSDFSQLPDVQASMSSKQAVAWKDYRQALRDITEQPGYPATIDWPVKPV